MKNYYGWEIVCPYPNKTNQILRKFGTGLMPGRNSKEGLADIKVRHLDVNMILV